MNQSQDHRLTAFYCACVYPDAHSTGKDTFPQRMTSTQFNSCVSVGTLRHANVMFIAQYIIVDPNPPNQRPAVTWV